MTDSIALAPIMPQAPLGAAPGAGADPTNSSLVDGSAAVQLPVQAPDNGATSTSPSGAGADGAAAVRVGASPAAPQRSASGATIAGQTPSGQDADIADRVARGGEALAHAVDDTGEPPRADPHAAANNNAPNAPTLPQPVHIRGSGSQHQAAQLQQQTASPSGQQQPGQAALQRTSTWISTITTSSVDSIRRWREKYDKKTGKIGAFGYTVINLVIAGYTFSIWSKSNSHTMNQKFINLGSKVDHGNEDLEDVKDEVSNVSKKIDDIVGLVGKCPHRDSEEMPQFKSEVYARLDQIFKEHDVERKAYRENGRLLEFQKMSMCATAQNDPGCSKFKLIFEAVSRHSGCNATRFNPILERNPSPGIISRSPKSPLDTAGSPGDVQMFRTGVLGASVLLLVIVITFALWCLRIRAKPFRWFRRTRKPQGRSSDQKKDEFDEKHVPQLMGVSTGSLYSTGAAEGSNRPRRRGVRQLSPWNAAFNGKLAEVESYLSGGNDINATDLEYGTLIAAAAEGGQADMVKYLRSRGADPSISAGKYGTALHSAAASGRVGAIETDQIIETIETLLDGENPDLDPPGPAGTPLCIAVEHKNDAAAKILIEKGADVNVQTSWRETLLQIASRLGSSDTSWLLIENGANVNVADDNGFTPLHHAAKNGRTAIAKALISKGALLDEFDSNHNTALHHASISGHTEIARALLANGAHPALPDAFQAHPLFRAAGLGHRDIVEMLLEKGSPVKAVEAFGQTALHGPTEKPTEEDIASGKLSIPELLVKYGAKINVHGAFGKTPLHQHVEGGSEWSVRFLLDRGADPYMLDIAQTTPLHHAITFTPEVVREKYTEMLRNNDKDVTALKLSSAGAFNEESYINIIIQRYQNIALLLIERMDKRIEGDGIEGKGGVTLQEAIVQKQDEIVTKMLEKGARVDVRGGEYGSAVAAAVIRGSLPMVEMLIAKGANVNIQGGEYGTPLQAACWLGHLEIVQRLLEHGATATATSDSRYGTALQAAKQAFEAAERNGSDIEELSRRQEICDLLENDYNVTYKPYNQHIKDRWKLTPAGWTWIPAGQH